MEKSCLDKAKALPGQDTGLLQTSRKPLSAGQASDSHPLTSLIRFPFE